MIRHFWKWLLLALLVILLQGGWLRRADTTGIDVTAAAELRDFLNHPQLRGLTIALSPEIQRFYFLTGYSLAWSQHGVPTTQAFAIRESFQNARTKGLDPEDYGAARLSARLAEMLHHQATCAELAKFDIEFTAVVIHFASDLNIGRIDPHQFHFALSSQRQRTQIPDFLVSRLISANDVSSALSDLEPPYAGYRRTELALAKYLKMAEDGEDATMPLPTKPVEAGDLFPLADQLQRRLIRLGDLTPSNTGQTTIYPAALAAGVRHFQERHGLDVSGLLDRATVNELNTSLANRVTQLELTLERWRWLPSGFDQPPVVVNIPEFRLRAYDENHHAALVMPVIVGKAYRHQTPVFQDDMEYVIFRPYWNVPLSIQRAELVPAIRKDSAYLLKHNFEIITRQGRIVSTDAVSASIVRQLYSGELEIRQRPGPQNALGLIKFVFPNQYDVYLHGTPAQELFRRPRRDFSHGCIRVEDPIALALWVFRSDPSWTVERIRTAMNGKDSVQVKLPKSIPVLILYGTAVVEENGDVHFFRDIYGHDAALLQGLEEHRRREQIYSGLDNVHKERLFASKLAREESRRHEGLENVTEIPTSEFAYSPGIQKR